MGVRVPVKKGAQPIVSAYRVRFLPLRCRGARRCRCVKFAWKIAPCEDNTLDAHHASGDAEEDGVVADTGHACRLANVWPRLIDRRCSLNCFELAADVTNERHSASGIAFGEECGDGIQIGLDKGRQFPLQGLAESAALAVA